MATVLDDESLVRSEIWGVARRYFAAGDWDKAIFEAFKKVEALVQTQIGSSEIGRKLFELAFGASPQVVVSPDVRDVASTLKLFDGAVGLYRGDRAHGDEPAVSFNSREECLRVLVLASALLDVLDRDENRAPKIASATQDTPTTIELLVERLTPSTEFRIDGTPAQILGRAGNVVRLKLNKEGDYTITVLANDSRCIGRPFKHAVVKNLPTGQNWHRVDEVEIELYTASSLTTTMPIKGVRLTSFESGMAYSRVFPTQESYSVGDYVSWEWDSSGTVPPAWVRTPSGSESVWQWSTYFAGQPVGKARKPSLVAISLRPSPPRLRVNEGLPVRVMARYSDGSVDTTEDVTARATIESEDPGIARAISQQGPALRGKSIGLTKLVATFEKTHTTSRVSVGPMSRGTVSEYLGGYQRITSMAPSPDGFFFVNQGDKIYEVGRDLGVKVVAKVFLPESAAFGIDAVAVSNDGDIYYRAAWDGSVRRRPASARQGSEDSVYIGAADVMTWSPNVGAVIADTKGSLWSWKGGTSEPTAWATLDGRCTDLVSTSAGVSALVRGKGIVELDTDGTEVAFIDLSELTNKAPRCLAGEQGNYFVGCFDANEVYEVTPQAIRVIADGFDAPYSLLLQPSTLLVANFGGDSIARVVL